MLYNTVSQAALAAGLDTHLGFLHVDQYAKPTFVFDLIEPFRPWVDLALVQACLDGRVKLSFFDPIEEKGLSLNRTGKHFIIPFFNALMEERIRWREQRLSRKNHIYRFASEFAQQLLTGQVDDPVDPDPLDLL